MRRHASPHLFRTGRSSPGGQSPLGRAAVLCALVATAGAGVSAGRLGAQTTAIVGATVLDGTGAEPVSDGVVLVVEGRIACVGTAGDCPVPPGAERVDASGRWVVPGLIDAHVHYSQTGWADGRPDALDVRDRFPYERTVEWLEENPDLLGQAYLCSGVTATFDVGGYPWTWGLRRWSDTSTTMPHIEAAGPLLSTIDHWLNLPAERQFLHIANDSSVTVGADYLVANGTSAVKVWFLVGSQVDTAALRTLMERAGARARDAGIPLIVHATGLWDAKVAVANGASLLVHSVEDTLVDGEFLDLARDAGTIYTPTLVVFDGYLQLATRAFDPGPYGDLLGCVDPTSLEKAQLTDSLPGGLTPDRADAYRTRREEGAATMAANLRRIRDAGIPIATGTDAGNPLTLHGPAIFLEMEAMAAAGLTPMEVLISSTAVAARAMGRGADLGTLEPGKVADLVILDADPLADVRNLRRIHAVMRGGSLVPHDRLRFRP